MKCLMVGMQSSMDVSVTPRMQHALLPCAATPADKQTDVNGNEVRSSDFKSKFSDLYHGTTNILKLLVSSMAIIFSSLELYLCVNTYTEPSMV